MGKIIPLVFFYKDSLALNLLQRLLCHEKQENQIEWRQIIKEELETQTTWRKRENIFKIYLTKKHLN